MSDALNTFIGIVAITAGWVYTFYVWGWFFRWVSNNEKLWRFGNHLCSEFRPFALFAIPIDLLFELDMRVTGWSPLWNVITILLHGLYFWLCLKDNKDDRWKKRRKKAAEKVKQVGGKLVVVPVPVGSRA